MDWFKAAVWTCGIVLGISTTILVVLAISLFV